MANNTQLSFPLNQSAATTMPSVIEKAISKAETMLKATNAKYIIVLPDGSVISHGELELAQPKQRKKRTRRDSSVPHGTYTLLLQSKGFDQMEKNDVLKIDADAFEPEAVRGTACSRASRLWGAGSVITTITGRVVEILRMK